MDIGDLCRVPIDYPWGAKPEGAALKIAGIPPITQPRRKSRLDRLRGGFGRRPSLLKLRLGAQ
jgi:hypothetical protein